MNRYTKPQEEFQDECLAVEVDLLTLFLLTVTPYTSESLLIGSRIPVYRDQPH